MNNRVRNTFVAAILFSLTGLFILIRGGLFGLFFSDGGDSFELLLALLAIFIFVIGPLVWPFFLSRFEDEYLRTKWKKRFLLSLMAVYLVALSLSLFYMFDSDGAGWGLLYTVPVLFFISSAQFLVMLRNKYLRWAFIIVFLLFVFFQFGIVASLSR